MGSKVRYQVGSAAKRALFTETRLGKGFPAPEEWRRIPREGASWKQLVIMATYLPDRTSARIFREPKGVRLGRSAYYLALQQLGIYCSPDKLKRGRAARECVTNRYRIMVSWNE